VKESARIFIFSPHFHRGQFFPIPKAIAENFSQFSYSTNPHFPNLPLKEFSPNITWVMKRTKNTSRAKAQ
jgi:hypothetical protein